MGERVLWREHASSLSSCTVQMPPLGFLQWKRGRIAQSFYPVPEKSMSFSCRHFKASARVDHWWSLYIISLANLHYIYIYIYVYIELVFFGVPILGLFRFTFCFLVTGTLNCPPPNPNARPQVISNAGSTAIYKLLARLCPCHESKICRIMPTSGPPSTSATAASLSRRLVWRRRAESDSHSDGAQKYMCSNRSNSTWWLIPLSKWVIFWYYSGYHLDE